MTIPEPSTPYSTPDPLRQVSDHAAADFLSSLIDPEESPSYTTGDAIGPYLLQEILGVGGFGIVWLAEQTHPVRRRVALKILKLGMDTVETLERFEMERESLARMEHPNIARVLDAGSTPEGRPYFAMEHVPGLPITRHCLEKPLTLEQRLRIFQDVCSGVQHAHQKGVIHRDLKPTNILVMEVDGAPIPKIIDFGIAKAITADLQAEQAFVTRREQMMGSPVYMSPEQVDAKADIDTRSDIYSLGALLYEIIAGVPLFDAAMLSAAGHQEMRRIICEEVPKPPSRRSGSGTSSGTSSRPTDLDIIVLQALEKNRERRYATVGALLEDIQRFLRHEPIRARPPKASYLLARWMRRHRVLTTATVVTLLALFLGGAATWQQKREAERQTREANTMMQMLMVTTVWETDKIDTVGLGKIGPALALAAGKVAALPPLSEERMRFSTGIGKAYLGLENWPKAIYYLNEARRVAIHKRAPYRIIRELNEVHCFGLIQGGRGLEALTELETLIPEFDQNLVPDDPSLIYIRQLKAEALCSVNRHSEALAIYAEIFALIKAWPNVPRPMDVVSARLGYPLALRLSGDAAAALQAARENVEVAKTGLGEVDVLYADTLVICAHECIESGEMQEALEHLEWAWQLYLDTYGPLHIRTRRYKQELLDLHVRLGRHEEAFNVWTDTLEILQTESGRTASATLDETARFATFLAENQQADEAVRILDTCLRDLESPALQTPETPGWRAKIKAQLAAIKAGGLK